jgi:peptidoglycan/LPS O-acetylase OafA/YrhL
MFISNEVVRIAWFGIANVLIARYALSTEVQWAIWGAGVLAAVGFAFAFHAVIDDPVQTWIKRRLARDRVQRRPVEQGAVVSIEG